MNEDDLIEGDPFEPDADTKAQIAAKQQRDFEEDEVVRILLRRQEAYKRVFAGAPVGNDVNIVIDDLRAFCRGEATTFHENPRIHALLTGRQEVYLRIVDHTRLSLDALIEKYAAK